MDVKYYFYTHIILVYLEQTSLKYLSRHWCIATLYIVGFTHQGNEAVASATMHLKMEFHVFVGFALTVATSSCETIQAHQMQINPALLNSNSST